MCLGVSDNLMMARIDPEVYDDALTRDGFYWAADAWLRVHCAG